MAWRRGLEAWSGGVAWRRGLEAWPGGVAWWRGLEAWSGGVAWRRGLEAWPIRTRTNEVALKLVWVFDGSVPSIGDRHETEQSG